MAGAMSDFLEAKVLDHTLGTTAYPMPTPYLGLFTVAPTDTGGGTEVTGGAYARQAITFDPAAGGAKVNAADVTFPTATANWGTIVAIGLFDAAVGGNLLYYGPLTASKTINTSDTFSVAAGDLSISLD